MDTSNFIHIKLGNYFDTGIPGNIKRNSHMNEFRGELTEAQATQILKAFDQSIKSTPPTLLLGNIADWIVPLAKEFCMGKDEMTKAVVVDFVNFSVMPLDLALYTVDL